MLLCRRIFTQRAQGTQRKIEEESLAEPPRRRNAESWALFVNTAQPSGSLILNLMVARNPQASRRPPRSPRPRASARGSSLPKRSKWTVFILAKFSPKRQFLHALKDGAFYCFALQGNTYTAIRACQTDGLSCHIYHPPGIGRRIFTNYCSCVSAF